MIARLVAGLVAALGFSHAHHAHHHHRAPKLPADYPAWTRVADCESGGWQVLGSAYPDPVGLTRQNFIAFDGHPLPVGPVPLAERLMVIRVADRFIRAYRIPIPDQHGSCAAY